jgi:TrmH family RNA methyltransferase
MEKNPFRIVLVGPEYEINMGAVCRAMANFGFSELYIVNPACPIGFEAQMHAKHAKQLLHDAKVINGKDALARAVSGCNLIVGTTGVLHRHRKTLRNVMVLPEFARKMKGEKGGRAARAGKSAGGVHGKVALLFGREGIGLMADEISKCDILVTIPTRGAYPIMNLSHAVAVMLYELSDIKLNTMEKAGDGERTALMREFDRLVERYAPKMTNPHKVKVAFRRMIGREMAHVECSSVIGVIRRANDELAGKYKIHVGRAGKKELPLAAQKQKRRKLPS